MSLIGLVSIVKMQPDIALEALDNLTKITYPWREARSRTDVNSEDAKNEAIKKYQDMQDSGKLKDVRKDAEIASEKGLFKKYDKAVPDRKREAPRHEF